MLRRSALAALAAAPLAAFALSACQSRPGGGAAAEAAPQRALPVVFFADDSAAMGPESRAVVAEAARRARARPGVPVAVRGFAAPDNAASPQFGRALAEARARNVADALVAEGVARERIRVQPRGLTSFEMMPVESRRVEIQIGA